MDTKVPQRTPRKTVIDHVEPEFVVFLVVHRELRDLASHIFRPDSKRVPFNLGLQVKLDKVGLIKSR